jgi:hypothetical protein
MKKYSCQCTRCDGTGRHDRGTCFDCKGYGFVSRCSTRHLTPFIVNVIFSNGTENKARIFATSRGTAVAIVERRVRMNGWTATVS